MGHQRRAFGSGFRKVGDHGYRRVVPTPVGFNVSRDQTPDSGVRVLCSCMKAGSKWRGRVNPKFTLTPWEQIEVTVSNEIFRALGVLLPDGILLDIYDAFSVSLQVTTPSGHLTWVPAFPFGLHELDRQQVLVDLDDLRDDN